MKSGSIRNSQQRVPATAVPNEPKEIPVFKMKPTEGSEEHPPATADDAAHKQNLVLTTEQSAEW